MLIKKCVEIFKSVVYVKDGYFADFCLSWTELREYPEPAAVATASDFKINRAVL